MKPRPQLALAVTLCACSQAAQVPPNTAASAPTPTPATTGPVAPGVIDAATPAAPEASIAVPLTGKSFPLPGATGPVSLDFIGYESAHDRVWVPVGDTGSADVFDIATSTFTRVDGFKSIEREAHGRKRKMGPSAVSMGDGVAYIGDRADAEVCAVPLASLELGACLKLPSATDGVVYVASEKEVWVTTPHDQSITVLDASTPAAIKPKLVITSEGEPECYAVDAAHGLFYTNLEDKNRTLVIDIKTHAIKATWSPQCGADGPRGVAVDGARNLVFVACTDGVQVLDAAHDGAVLGHLDTGAGVDNIDYDPATKLLYVAAGKAARLTIARIDDQGQATVVATAATSEGMRNAVVDSQGNVYVADSKAAKLWVFAAPAGK